MCARWHRYEPLTREELEELREWLRDGGAVYVFAKKLGRGTDSWLKNQVTNVYGTTFAELAWKKSPKARKFVDSNKRSEWEKRVSVMCDCYGSPSWFCNIINSETGKRWK